MKMSLRKSGALLCAAALGSATLVACSSESSDSASEPATNSATNAATATAGAEGEGRGPITFAMGRNDTDKIVPIIEKWNAEHPD